MEYLFSFDGRADRQAYWMSVAISIVVNAMTIAVVMFLIDAEARGDNTGGLIAATIVMSIISLIVSLSVLSFQVRRWHDLDKSGWWTLIGLVPIVGGLYAFGMQGFVPGTEGRNSYGPPFRRDQLEAYAKERTLYKESISAKRAAEIQRKTVV